MILTNQHRVLVYGITGKQGSFWAEKMLGYGTNIVGGINPKKAGTMHLDLPVWGSGEDAAQDATNDTNGTNDAAVLFIPPMRVKDAVLDALKGGIKNIVVLTEHIPVHDVMHFLAAGREAGAQILGPNTAGMVRTGQCFLGFMPAFNENIFKPGRIGVISRSGSLGTLICLNLVRSGLGISSFIGIGGDPIIGTTTQDALKMLDEDADTDAVALVGEIGGVMEEEAAEYAAQMDKPIAAFIAGAESPPDKKMGHAGAIVVGKRGSYESKKQALEEGGVVVCGTPADIPSALSSKL